MMELGIVKHQNQFNSNFHWLLDCFIGGRIEGFSDNFWINTAGLLSTERAELESLVGFRRLLPLTDKITIIVGLSNNKDIYPSLRVADLVWTTGFWTTGFGTTTTINNRRCTRNNKKCWLTTRTRNQSLYSLFTRRTRFSSAFNMPFSYMFNTCYWKSRCESSRRHFLSSFIGLRILGIWVDKFASARIET